MLGKSEKNRKDGWMEFFREQTTNKHMQHCPEVTLRMIF